MKQFFLWAVVLSALCSSCETADETFLEEKNNTHYATAKHSGEWNDYEVYQNIVNTFVYDMQQTHQENLTGFEQHVNFLMAEEVYEPIDFEQLWLLENAGKHFVEQLGYSVPTKEAIYGILNQSFDPETMTLPGNEQERRLIQTLFALHSNGNGDDGDDDEWDHNKTIAFAYGAQYSLAQAVLYAGAVELRRYQ